MDYSQFVKNSAGANYLPSDDPTGYKVDLFFKCRKLKDLDTFSKSDPQVRVYMKENNSSGNAWKKVGETEIIKNNLDPDFKTAVQIFYKFEVQQHIRFEVIDSDGPTKFDLEGTLDTTVGRLMGAKDFTFSANLMKEGDKSIRGQIIVMGVPIKQSNAEIILKLGARNLPMSSTCLCFKWIKPYIEIEKGFNAGDATNFVAVKKTEVS